MSPYLKVVLALAVLMPACDQFVCSQQRIKAMEMNNKGVEEFKNNLYDSAERDFKLAKAIDTGLT